MTKPIVAVYDAKPYDRDSLTSGPCAECVEWVFHPFRLESATAASAEGASAVCIFVNDHADADALTRLKETGIRHVALRCAGYNNVDLETARQHNMAVTRVPSYSPHAVAEHTLALLLTLNRRIHRAYNRVRELNFSLTGLVGFDLHGKTIGIVGTGRTGTLVAEFCIGFGMRVLAHDPDPKPEWAEGVGITYTDMDVIIKESDIISLHAPLTPETHHLINNESVDQVKQGAILINVSRGRLVDTTALIAGLKSGKLGGVALDVYEEEEGIFFEDLSNQVLQDDELARLLTFNNVLITSHQAFLTREALSEIAQVTTENILLLHENKPPLPETELT